MAGMDYGGRTFRNGIHMPQCDDGAVVLNDLPMAMAGTYEYEDYNGDREEGHWIKEPLWYFSDNAVLGDGPVYLALHRQTGFQIYQYGKEKGLIEYHHGEFEGNHRSAFIDGHQIDIYLYNDENNKNLNNFYVFGRLVQPDGTVWTGFSGCACGAGWDDDVKRGWENTQIAQNELTRIFSDSKVEYHEMDAAYFIEFFNRRLKQALKEYWNNREIHWEDQGYDQYDPDEHENRKLRQKFASMDIAEIIVQADQRGFKINISTPEERSDE